MLISFRMQNFRSFAGEASLSMRPIKAYGEHFENVVSIGDSGVLKVAAIYGANASGKSNVVKGIGTMRRLVLHSLRMSSVDSLAVEPFGLDETTISQPTLFEVSIVLNGKIVRYGFAATMERIVAEWLGISAGGARSIERLLFTREGDKIESFNRRNIPELAKFEVSTLLPNALLLPRLDQLNNPMAKSVMKWFSDLTVMSGSRSSRYGRYSADHIQDKAFHDRMMQFIQFADSSVEEVSTRTRDIDWDDLPDFVRLGRSRPSGRFRAETHEVMFSRTNRQGRVIPFEMGEKESEGTEKMFALSGPLTDILNKGSVLVIDEMEAKLHPLLTRRIVRVFNSPKTNPLNAQLIFVTHDATLLHLGRLRRDQVWFCEKDRSCVSTLYSLAEIRSTAKARREDNLEKKYLEGRFGAVPSFRQETFL